MAPPVPPRTKRLERSFTIIGSCEVPSSTPTEAVYEDIDSLKTHPMDRSLSLTTMRPSQTHPMDRSPSLKTTIRPSPLPRYKSCRQGRPPPPSPPRNKRLTSCGSTATLNGGHDNSSTTLETVRPDGGERCRSPSPLPPPRPPPPSSYLVPSEYERGLTHQYVNTAESGGAAQRRPQQPPPPAFTPPPPPPPPPRPVTRPAVSATYSSGVYTCDDTQGLYTAIEYPPYLEVLPDENHNRIRPSNSTYKQYMGLERATPPRTPPPPPTGPRCPNADPEEDVDSLLRWLKTMAYSKDMMAPSLYGLNIEDETREFNQRALNMQKALRLYDLLLTQRHARLRGLIGQLRGLSDSVDKAQRKTKTMGIAGGATGAVGGVAAVVGIALAPVTMGVSLIATAVGAGMVASAGGMGAQAAVSRRKCVERRTVDGVVRDYGAAVADPERCVALLRSGTDELRRHDLGRLQRAGGARPEALRMARRAQSMFDATAHVGGGGGGMASERLLQSFAKEMDLYFTEKDGQRLNRSAECKFMSRVRLLAQDLQGVLDELNTIWKEFSLK